MAAALGMRQQLLDLFGRRGAFYFYPVDNILECGSRSGQTVLFGIIELDPQVDVGILDDDLVERRKLRHLR